MGVFFFKLGIVTESFIPFSASTHSNTANNQANGIWSRLGDLEEHQRFNKLNPGRVLNWSLLNFNCSGINFCMHLIFSEFSTNNIVIDQFQN